jgi:2-(1,2-epoxy-1,2-dihydrophenyl)acetyl-CoA isomerase
MSTVTLTVAEHVATLTLNRPDVANTMDLAFGQEFHAAALQLAADPAVRAVILTGAGKQFCFGGDLRGMMAGGDNIQQYLRDLTSNLHAGLSILARMNAPVIAAVNGTAAGAGVGLVLAADLAIAAQSAKVSLAYTGVGLTPDGATSFLLPRAVGHKRAMELLLTNRTLSAEECLQWGLVNQVVPDELLLAEALKLATRLANGPTQAFGDTKRLLLASAGALETQLAAESQTIAYRGASAEAREGLSAFLEKRKPNYPR